MDRCEEDVIIGCGVYLLVEEEKRKKRKYWIHKVFRARGEEGEFHTLFGHLKDGRQIFFKYFRMSFSKFEKLKQLLHTGTEKKNTRWRRSIRTEERRALTLRLVHKNVYLQIICLGAHHNRFNTPQKAVFVLKMWRL